MPFNTTRWRRLGYTLWAPVYDLLAKPLAPARRLAIDRLAPVAGERVLVVGAGTGLDLDFLPPGVVVTAIDLTPAMLNRLERRASQLGLPVTTSVMDAQAMTFADASFDAAVLNLILAVVPDPVRCASEVARVLRPGGRAVVLDKFVPDAGPVSLGRKLLNPLASFFGTEITRRLGPIIDGTGLRVRNIESAGRSGYLVVAVLEKPSDTPC
ncbi:MAG: class I SAM-dependent methyltransferase [Phycisphaerae bacterium]|nr:methyltransferase domain-containing protein [Tepidisphaeraceae bacterium]